ncbi:4Fe-4S dicluster domain-containing protein [Caldisphaera sp.]|uniref:4Fe-4S dicluster domain-containing protein n=1 Tax=Caldisphaera sp. TaxID=2060322 RepID=UPI0026B263E6
MINDVMLFDEVNRCMYCGFCESVCPTISLGPHRGYGPRGRVNLIKEILKNNTITEEVLSSIYSCLLCNACNLVCPAKIDIGRAVREVRAIINNYNKQSIKKKIIIRER